MNADAVFAAAANAAAAAFAATPPAISYTVSLRVRRGDAVSERTSAIASRSSEGNVPPALPPAVDALAQWAFALDDRGAGDVRMRVTYERPKRYAFATPGPAVDVVVPGIAGYAVRFADGDPSHVVLAPATPDVRAFAAQSGHFVYRDVIVDPATSLPRRVVVAAPHETLALDYGVHGAAWLLDRVTYDGPKLSVDARYDDYAFPAATAAPAASG